MHRSLRRRPEWLAWALPVAAVILVALGGILATGHTLVTRDTARIHAPLRGLVVEAPRDFRLPLWNPHEATGLPLLAQMVHGALHPVSLVAAALAPNAGMDLLIVAYAACGALGMAAFVRGAGGSSPAAVGAGLGYGLSGYVLSMGSVLHYQAAAATAPWVLAALRGAGIGHGAVAAGALAVAALHFAGDPQWTLLAAILGLALAMEAKGGRGLAWGLISVILGTALAGVQLWCGWSYLAETVRGSFELAEWERGQWALAPWRLLELGAPGFFSGRLGSSLHALVFVKLGGTKIAIGSFLPAYTTPFVPSVFVGGALLVLALLGAFHSRLGRLLGVATLGLLWIALGPHLGAEQALHAIPVWGSFRYPEKVVGPLTLCLAFLGGLGIDRLARARPRHTVLVGAVALATMALAVWLNTEGGEALLLRAGAGEAAPQARAQLAVGLIHAAAGLGLLAVLFAVAWNRRGFRRHLPMAAAALVGASSLVALPFSLHFGTPGAREARPLSALVGTSPVVRVGTPLRGVLRPEPATLDPTDRMLALESRMGVTPYAASAGIDQIDTYTALLPTPFVLVDNVLGFDRDPRYWQSRRRYGVTHVVIREPRGPREAARAAVAVAGGRRVFDDQAWGLSVWEVPHRPWAAFAEHVIAVDSATEARAALARVAFGGGSEVVIEGNAPATLSSGKVFSIERRPERVRVDAEAEGAGLLIVNDAFWPGWTARIDGRPVPILRADALVRAVPWPPARHALEMRYEPTEVRLGLAVSIAGTFAVAGLLIRLLWIRRRLIAAQSGRPGETR